MIDGAIRFCTKAMDNVANAYYSKTLDFYSAGLAAEAFARISDAKKVMSKIDVLSKDEDAKPQS